MRVVRAEIRCHLHDPGRQLFDDRLVRVDDCEALPPHRAETAMLVSAIGRCRLVASTTSCARAANGSRVSWDGAIPAPGIRIRGSSTIGIGPGDADATTPTTIFASVE
ncbi:hypothetical protein [Agromyces bauzanensis]|uniref:hypothetical protein n=1 Tax=Agromyces bauzanensis TaxID=1308924 RepID=UPI0031EA708D